MSQVSQSHLRTTCGTCDERRKAGPRTRQRASGARYLASGTFLERDNLRSPERPVPGCARHSRGHASHFDRSGEKGRRLAQRQTRGIPSPQDYQELKLPKKKSIHKPKPTTGRRIKHAPGVDPRTYIPELDVYESAFSTPLELSDALARAPRRFGGVQWVITPARRR